MNKSINHSISAQIRLVAALSVLTFCTGCTRTNRVQFQEEVMLHDGRIIVIEREGKEAIDLINKDASKNLLDRIKYAPGGIDIKSTSPDYISLDQIDGTYYIVTNVPTARYCEQHGPDTPYLQVKRWDGKQWTDVELKDAPIQKMTQNLEQSYWHVGPMPDQQGLLTWNEKIDKYSYRYMDTTFRVKPEYKAKGAPYPLQVYVESGPTCIQIVPSVFSARTS